MSKNEKVSDNVPVLVIGGVSDIHYDDPKELNNSIHKETYKRAVEVTREIIQDTKREKKNSGDDRSKGTGIRNREQICNIIFFTGEKGTGKTSSMLSYMEFLKDYYRNVNDRNYDLPMEFKLHEQNENGYMFTGIDYIDASALNGQEDILGNVLARMLSKWKNEEQKSQSWDTGIVRGSDYDYKKRQLRLQFSEMYERLKELESKERATERDSDMFIEAIESMSFSSNVKKSFQKLVESYLDIMVYPDADRKIGEGDHYLVISIDDLDMNVQSGFQLLEQIRKYLMVPRVLILMSANYEQLEKICCNHYGREFDKIRKDEGIEKYMRKLSREYLEKMVPLQRQIALLSNDYWEYFSDCQIKIECNLKNNRLQNELCQQNTLSNIVANCMKKCFGVRFGLDNKCIRYLAPGTIRETCSWVHQMSNLSCCCEDNNQVDLEDYKANVSWFWRNEFPRLCKKYLDVNQHNFMKMLQSLEPTEQIKRTRAILCEEMDKKKDGKKNGSLLELLNEAKKYDERMQSFAYLCVIYFNMKLADIIIHIEGTTDKNDKEKYQRQLMQYYSTPEWGIWGSWEDKLITMSIANSKNNTDNQKDLQFVNIARNTFQKDNNCFVWDIEAPVDGGYNSEYFKRNAADILLYQYYLLFYTVGTTCKMDDSLFYFDEKEGRILLSRSISGVFSLSSFVLNQIQGAPLVVAFRRMLDNLLKKYGVKEDEHKELYDKLFFNLEENGLVLPIDNIDFLMYLGTEIQREFGYKGVMEQENVVFHLRKYFTLIYDCLKKYDPEMAGRFKSSRPVRKILEERSTFGQSIFNGIKAHMVSYVLTGDYDWEWSDY